MKNLAIEMFLWVLKTGFYPKIFKADIEGYRKFFTGYMLTHYCVDHLASFIRERIEEFNNKYSL